MDLSGKHLLLGVSGGIAAYKSVYLLREFQKAGADVRVVMTKAATRFVGVETFATLSRHEVAVDVFNESDPGDTWTRHIHWAEWADLFVIAPCTANTLGKLVHGLADNMITSVALAARCPLLLCPTMDAEMIDHPAVKANMRRASEFGFQLLEPDRGYLASGIEGSGRLPEPSDILRRAGELLGTGKKPLEGKQVLVTAGPTRESIDAVRYISNPSSGKMGIAMAEAARQLGASVLLLHGPVSQPIPDSVESIRFTTANELFDLVKEHSDAVVVIMAAAVADFRPDSPESGKLKKENGPPSIKLTPTPDILKWLGEVNQSGQTRIGFAMETDQLIENARKKLLGKNMHWICANNLLQEESGFESDNNRITLLNSDSDREFSGSKKEIALQILRHIFDR